MSNALLGFNPLPGAACRPKSHSFYQGYPRVPFSKSTEGEVTSQISDDVKIFSHQIHEAMLHFHFQYLQEVATLSIS